MKNNTVVVIVSVILALGLGFFSGMKYAEYQQSQRFTGNRSMQNGLGTSNQGLDGSNQARNGLNGRPIVGEVISKDEKSITVKTQDGGSKIVLLSSDTSISKTAEGTLTDITVGANVGVFGTENSDKSITAQNIQLNPQFKMGSSPAR